MDNLDFLYRYKLYPIENKYENQIINLVEQNKKISAFELANLISQNLKDYPTISNCIWDLVCKEKLRSDLLSAKVTMNSFVELVNE